MNKPKFFPETALYIVAFLIAFGIRLVSLGGSFLTNPEATWALQALHLAQGTHPDIGAQPGLVLFTGSLFFVFGSSEFLARLAPALVGSLLVFSPLLFSDRLGKTAAGALAFALALDPGLVAMSRQVDGHILALSFTLLGMGFLIRKNAAGAGIFSGLAFLGGASFWLGGLIILLTGLVYLGTKRGRRSNASLSGVETEPEPAVYPGFIKLVLLWFAGTVFFGGTLFFLEPKGLSAIAASLAAFIQGLSGAGGVSFTQVLGGLLFYEVLPLVLAVIASIRAILNKNRTDELLALAWLTALAVVVLYPGRQVGDLVWVAVPMWALGVRFIVQVFSSLMPVKLVIGESILTIVILVCAWLNFIAAMALQFADATPHWLSIVFMFFFLGIAVILLTWGWGLKVALQGVGLGVCFLMVIFTLSAAWRATGQESRPEQELWITGSDFREADLLLKTANDYSLWNTNNPIGLDLTVENGSPSLQWLFRNFTQVSFVDELQADAAPSMVVTPEQTSLSLSGLYTGQNFVTEQSPSWSTLSASDWINWMIFRQAPLTKTTVVLWVRSDLFPGSSDFRQNKTP
jgi:hypothetical protein